MQLEANCVFKYEVDEKENLFVFFIRGNGQIDGKIIDEKSAVLLSDGNRVEVKSLDKAVRFIIFHALPLNEPIAWAGPIVMNTKDELKTAFDELERGEFIQ